MLSCSRSLIRFLRHARNFFHLMLTFRNAIGKLSTISKTGRADRPCKHDQPPEAPGDSHQQEHGLPSSASILHAHTLGENT
jgi:hypothetical protein